ncbi:hypothetical protein QUB60_25985 [Microcoleus sp. A2-C5]|uniref:hypothetical protein n=1 Tax=Microcoleaceae TaxID=1892252 RepID=UPI0022387AEC|nr:hypothetical protein [Lyngbya sp. CCAP 1446/10]MCW6050750.1 hypothetical protein [Lyngbya sp. CCAP 1446/10]
MSSPVFSADWFYLFLKHKAIVLGSDAIGVCFAQSTGGASQSHRTLRPPTLRNRVF